MRQTYLLSIVVFIILKSGLFAQNNPIGITYHNVTAHYNGYFYAKERIREIEQLIEDQYSWNYNRVLPIFPQFDTTTSKAFEEQLEDCIVKASIAIQRHPESRWEDDAYILVGKARLYGSEFPDAVETFKWVNTNGDDKNDQHHALTILLRTFIEARELRNALAVYDYLKKRELSEENLRRFHLNSAYYFQVRGDLNEMVNHLVQAEEVMPGGPDRARLDFIIGQVYQELGFEANAYTYYKKALKRSNVYELSFYTRLNMAQVTEMKSDNVKRVQRYFRKLLKDPKNTEYQDRIYYEMGEFDLKRGEIQSAIDFFKQSASVGQDPRQKSYAFLSLATIYYDSLKNYSAAKNYYDSTVQVIPKDEIGYEEIKKRQEVLSEFVQYYEQLQTNDSLLTLSRLSKNELDAVLQDEVRKREEQFLVDKELKKRERRRAMVTNSGQAYNEGNQITINQEFSGTWYFYNTTEVSAGLSEFQRVWGNRPLQDNWRLSSLTTDLPTTDNTSEQTNTEQEEEKELSFDPEAVLSELMTSIPTDTNQINGLKKGIEDSYYNLGKIYYLKLDEKSNAVTCFDSLISRFPQSSYLPEVLYQLFLIQRNSDSAKAWVAANTLQNNFPETVYAKLIFNPNYREEQKAINDAYKIIYQKAYDLFDDHKYDESLILIDSALQASPENDILDNLTLLRAMNFGETEGIYKYQYELNNFIKNYPESEVVDHAKLLVKASEDFQINLYSSSKARFINYFDTSHYHIIVYHQKPGLGSNIIDTIEPYLTEYHQELNTGNLVLDGEFSLILISELRDKVAASSYLDRFSKAIDFDEIYKGEKIHSMVITKENFEILYETKDLDSYLTFYYKSY